MKIENLALTFVHGLGIKGTQRLLEIFGTAKAIFDASEQDLRLSANLGKSNIVSEILSKKALKAAETELTYCNKHNIIPIAATDSNYPQLLKEIPDHPHIIYVQGNPNALNLPSVAVVGTRNMSNYGQRMAHKLVEQLHEIVPTVNIVSGLAIGNDGNAHRAALQCGASTVAVIANALPNVTPAEHRTLADKILYDGGAIVTEVSSQTKNNGRFFSPRNRLIAGLASGTVVVESPYNGGSLQTADYALDYGRIVMALPARANDKTSYGSNLYIKQMKAAMVCSGSDIVHELGWDIEVYAEQVYAPSTATVETIHLTDEERMVVEAIDTGAATDYDTIAERCGLAMPQITAHLISLELCGVVRLLPGKRAERT